MRLELGQWGLAQGEWDAFLQKEAPPEPLWVAWETALLVHGVRSGTSTLHTGAFPDNP